MLLTSANILHAWTGVGSAAGTGAVSVVGSGADDETCDGWRPTPAPPPPPPPAAAAGIFEQEYDFGIFTCPAAADLDGGSGTADAA